MDNAILFFFISTICDNVCKAHRNAMNASHSASE